jgi:hypothetical protein
MCSCHNFSQQYLLLNIVLNYMKEIEMKPSILLAKSFIIVEFIVVIFIISFPVANTSESIRSKSLLSEWM